MFYFIQDKTTDDLKAGKLYFETNSSIDKLDLNEIHFVLKIIENNIIIDCVFQDSFTGQLISEIKDDTDDQSFLCMPFNQKTEKEYTKIKED